MDDLQCTLVIPAAGQSTRFRPLNKILLKFMRGGKYGTMLEHAVPPEWRGPVRVAVRQCDLTSMPAFVDHLMVPRHPTFIAISDTRGQAHTVVQAVDNVMDDILVINSDNGFDGDVTEWVRLFRQQGAQAGAVVFNSSEKRYGYVNTWPYFTHCAEKHPISMFALAGAFYFKDRETLVDAYLQAELNNFRGELYLSDLYRYIAGKKVAHLIPRAHLHEWGTPEAFEADTGEKIITEGR